MYVRAAAKAEERGATEHRRRLLAGLRGTVVELGAGHGLNFALYPEAVTEVVAIERGRRHREPGAVLCAGPAAGADRAPPRRAGDSAHPGQGAPGRGLTIKPVSGTLRFVVTYQADGLTALGDPTRRAIFERLAERPRAVGELASELPVSRPAVSQHLRVLKEARLVVDRPVGTRRIYQVDSEGLALLRVYLDHFWDQALAGYKAAVEQRMKESP
jgi:DNA-binding transcriptional ArsR family regulator